MLASKSKLSTFAAANRTITAACQTMKNAEGQAHQSERGKKIVTTESNKSEYQNHDSIFGPAESY